MFRPFPGSLLLAAFFTACLGGVVVAPGVVRAQAREPGAEVRHLTGPAGERQRLRTELDRVNAEIDALKRESRGLRDDYRLRNRMADAEALARRLTELDARQRARGSSVGAVSAAPGVTRGPTSPWPAAPEAQASDDRAVLEAKADILADQARRLNTQADALAGRVTALRGRQELRRRAGQLERDPFSQLEQAKRRLAASGSQALGAGAPREVADVAGAPRTDTTIGTPTGGPGMQSTPGASVSPPSKDIGGFTTTGASPSAPAGFVSKAQPVPAGGSLGTTEGAAGSVAAQFRGILDASTLAEIRRLELSGSAAGSLPALERALSALRARAAELSGSADALRTRAKTTR